MSKAYAQMTGHKSQGRSRITNGRLLPGVDGRLAAARRFRDVTELLTRELSPDGDPLSTSEIALIRQCALVVAQSEEMQLAAARGEGIDPQTLVRLSNLALRIVSRLERLRKTKPRQAIPLRERLLHERGSR